MITQAQIDSARREAESWIGTPHVHRACVKGLAVDCVHLAVSIYKAAWLMPLDYEPPTYQRHTGLFERSSEILDALKTIPGVSFGVFPVSAQVQDLDLIIFKTGGTSGHVGVILGDEIFHALGGRTVTRNPWKLWRHSAAHIIRLST